MRYGRQERLVKQKALSDSLVTIVGCGGTGSAAAEYLVRAGVPLRLIDRDIVELSNLQRQLYREGDVGKPKAAALRERLLQSNSEIKIEAVSEDLNSSNIEKLLKGSSLVLDGADNMNTRFLMNDYCLKNRIPFTYAASIKSEGLFTLIIPKKSPCLQCFVPLASEGRLDTCETAGIVGPVAGTIGAISAAEAINFLSGSRTITGILLHMSFEKNSFQTIELGFRKNCRACSGEYLFLDEPRKTIIELCGGTYQYIFSKDVNLSFIAGRIAGSEFKIERSSDGVIVLGYKDKKITLFKNRMLIQNVFSEREVKTIASKIIGV